MIMGQMKELVLTVEDLLDAGYDEVDIAAKLGLPLDIVEELVKQSDEERFAEDMAGMPYEPTEIDEWNDFDPDC